MFILSINSVSLGSAFLSGAGKVIAFPLYVIGGVSGAVCEGLLSRDPGTIVAKYATPSSGGPGQKEGIGLQVYKAIRKGVGKFLADGRVNIRKVDPGTALANAARTGDLTKTFIKTVKNLKPSGNTLAAAGVITAVGLIGFGAVKLYSVIFKDWHRVAHHVSNDLVQSEAVHLGFGAAAATMIISGLAVPFVGLGVLAFGVPAAAICYFSPFIKRQLGGAGILHRPDQYLPGRLGIAARRAIDPDYRSS